MIPTNVTPDTVVILHENDEWLPPFVAALESEGLKVMPVFVNEGFVPVHTEPPKAIYYNRMSASSASRDHTHAPSLTRALLHWLEEHNCVVVNGSEALYLEVDKHVQYSFLRQQGLITPTSIPVVGRAALLPAADSLGAWPVIVKPSRGGKGLGVRRFDSREELAAWVGADVSSSPAVPLTGALTSSHQVVNTLLSKVDGAAADGKAASEADEYSDPVDGLWVVQSYVKADHIYRVEMVGGVPVYTLRVATAGAFQHCPADVCSLDKRGASLEESTFCPLPSMSFSSEEPEDSEGSCGVTSASSDDDVEEVVGVVDAEKFNVLVSPPEGIVALYPQIGAALQEAGVDVAGVEMIFNDSTGSYEIFDINTNTNYNAAAEARVGVKGRKSGPGAVAMMLSELANGELSRLCRAPSSSPSPSTSSVVSALTIPKGVESKLGTDLLTSGSPAVIESSPVPAPTPGSGDLP